MAFDVRVEDRSVHLEIVVESPRNLDISSKEVTLSYSDKSDGQTELQASCLLPVLVLPESGANSARYTRRKPLLQLTLQRECPAGSWPLLEEVEHRC